MALLLFNGLKPFIFSQKITLSWHDYIIICYSVMGGRMDHSCMYFTPIRFGILSRTNQSLACIYESFLQIFVSGSTWYGHFCFTINLTLLGHGGLKSLFPALDLYVPLGQNIVCGF